MEQAVPGRVTDAVAVSQPEPQGQQTNTAASMSSVILTMRGCVRGVGEPDALASVAALIRERMLIFRASTMPIKAAKIMIPSPPTWMSTRITICPKPRPEHRGVDDHVAGHTDRGCRGEEGLHEGCAAGTGLGDRQHQLPAAPVWIP